MTRLILVVADPRFCGWVGNLLLLAMLIIAYSAKGVTEWVV